MKKLTVTKDFTWDSAHMLEGHKGLCQNVHGHTYKMHVEVSHPGESIRFGPSEGMVVDFSELKRIVKEGLVDKLDHAFICITDDDVGPKEKRVVEVFEELGLKIYYMQERPTAENMAKEFSEVIRSEIDMMGMPLTLESVTVWETPTSFAKYEVN